MIPTEHNPYEYTQNWQPKNKATAPKSNLFKKLLRQLRAAWIYYVKN